MAKTEAKEKSIVSGIFGWFKNTFNEKYWDSLKFSLYCLTHPLDGFWDLTHEKRGTYAAANTILIATVLVRLLNLKYTSFVIQTVYWEDLNVWLYIASILFPLALEIGLRQHFSTVKENSDRFTSVLVMRLPLTRSCRCL